MEWLHRAWLYDWSIGWLPYRVQIALSERILFDPEDASRHSAWVLTVFFLFTLWAFFGTSLSLFWFALLTLEALRAFHISSGGNPVGHFTFEVIDVLVRMALRGRKVD